ncbi:MAG: hypothetical protein KDA54_18215 [Phycisphaerales bacterium]|nr:hypothetical protein [Phycisphaerales bacterium]
MQKRIQRWLVARPQLRRFALRGGLAGALLCVCLFVLTRYVAFGFASPYFAVAASEGAIGFGYVNSHSRIDVPGFFLEEFSRPSKTRWWAEVFADKGSGWLILPLWVFLLPCLIAVIFAWRSKPIGLNACKHCDYDLTGNESGICPECGTPIVTA